MLLFIVLLLFASVISASAEGVTVIGETTGVNGTLQIGECISIDKVCDFTLLSYVGDTYALAIAPYERPEDELFLTPEAKGNKTVRNSSGTLVDSWGSMQRYKYKNNSNNKPGYAIMYGDIGAAKIASSNEFKLLDVRVSVLNKMISPMDVQKVFSAKSRFMDEYDFPLTYVCMETADTLGNPNEWLVDVQPIPMLVQRNIHFIFEVPNVVVESNESLVVTLGVNKDEYEIVIR